MMLIHELGHVAAAVATGGQIVFVDLYPGRISSTLVQPNPRPGVVLWGGFLSGWLVPLAVAVIARRAAELVRWPLECWAAFCLLAGGVYLAAGGLERFSDTGQLVAEGWSLAPLVVIGIAIAAAGYAWSRRTWPQLLATLSVQSSHRSVAITWILIVLWIGGQWWLASWLSPLPNVR